MSDLAVVDLTIDSPPVQSGSVALLGPSSGPNTGVAASLEAMLRGLPSGAAVVENFPDAAAVVVVAPRFGKNKNESAHLARLAVQAKMRGQVIAFVGASVGELDTRSSRSFTRAAIKHADLTVMRDEESAHALLEIGVEPPLRVGADPAWSELGDLFAAPDVRDQVVIALDAGAGIDEVDNLAGVLRPVAASGLDVVLQPWDDALGRHFPVAEMIADRVGPSATVIEPPATLREARDLYSTSRAVLALPFHALMAAASSGSRTVAVGTGPTKRLASTLGVPVFGSGAHAAAITDTLQDAIAGDSTGNGVVPQLVDRARATIDITRFLVTKGEDYEPSANEPLPLYPNPWRS